MKGIHLGELEGLVLLTVALLKDEAYGVSVKSNLLDKASRKVNISAVHAVLHRLEKKGLLTSYFGESSAVRGGRRKRLFKLTTTGLNSLQELKMIRTRMYEQIPGIELELNKPG